MNCNTTHYRANSSSVPGDPTFSSDFGTRITPCQFGGNPDCANCGCIASAGLEAIGRHRLKGGIPVGRIFNASVHVGRAIEKLRNQAAQLTP